jgi:hypothetical protein
MNGTTKEWNDLSDVEKAESTFWDFYKEVHGYRPRHIDTSSWTMEDFDAEFKSLAEQAAAQRVIREKQEKWDTEKFEKRIIKLMECGAKSREMAIRWIDDAEGSSGDMSYLCYLLGLPYGYINDNIISKGV